MFDDRQMRLYNKRVAIGKKAYVREQLRDQPLRQAARDERRAKKNAANRVAQRKAKETRLTHKDEQRPLLEAALAWGERFESLARSD
jgi:hypothetical protein